MLNVSASPLICCQSITNTTSNYEVTIYNTAMQEIFEDYRRGCNIPDDEISQLAAQRRGEYVEIIQGLASDILS
jgi:hypothetical protein